MARYEVDGTSARAPEEEGPFLQLVKNEITPDTTGRGSITPDGSKKQNQKIVNINDARKRLLNNETAAAGVIPERSSGVAAARQSETVSPINYTGKGKSQKSNNKISKAKGFLKNKGAFGFIIALFIVVAIVITNSQTIMPFSLLAQFRETFDSIKVSNEVRTKTMWTKQLEEENLKNPLHKKYFGFGGDTFKVRSRQKSKLKTQGIYVDEDFAGTGKSAMLFDDGSGKLKIIAARDADINTLKGADISKVNFSEIDPDIDFSKFEIDTDNVITFRTAYTDVSDFRNGYIKSSRTWRGAIGAWFDSITVRFLQSNSITRNRFRKYQERVQSEQAGNTRSAAKQEVVNLMETDADELDSKSKTYDIDSDEDGKLKVDEDSIKTDTDSIKTKGATKAEIQAKMNEIKNSKLGKASGYVSAAVNVACSVFDIIGAINLLIVAQESIQIIQVVTSYFEAIDKVKAGKGDGSPIHVLAEGLTTPKATTVMKNTTDDINELQNNENIDIEEVTVEGRENATAMQSEGISALYSGTVANPNDSSIQNFNIGSRFNTILGHIGSSLTSFAACAIAKASAAAVDFGIEVAAIITCAASFGIGCVVNEIGQAAAGGGMSIAIGLAATFAINIITPLAVKAFTRDLISDLAGEDLGNALVSGANMYMGTNHLQGGGSLASFDKYVAYAHQQQTVIAEEAKFERETKSPFDATSPYTFMGNLVKQMATIYTIKSPVFGSIGTVSSMVSNSLIALTPAASAMDVAETLPNMNENSSDYYGNTCPYLASIGAVGDAFCNPYMITDMSTINEDPLNIVDVVNSKGGFDDDGSIKKGSNLANYISYCSQRGSAFGVADGNIANNFSTDVDTGNSTANTVVNGAIGSIPLVGDFLDIYSNSNQLANTGWITGQSCVASNDSLESSGTTFGVSWDENKYYQRFIEDQRYLESTDSDYTSPVTAFLDEYYEENPLDTSYEGILARKSGMSKDEVVAYLEVIQEWKEIADYDPSTRYQMGKNEVVSHKLRFDSNEKSEQAYIIINIPITWEWKQRSIAMA